MSRNTNFPCSERRKNRGYGPVSVRVDDERINLLPDDEEEDDGGRGGELMIAAT